MDFTKNRVIRFRSLNSVIKASRFRGSHDSGSITVTKGWGEYNPDLIAFGEVIVETKTIERITDAEVGRMLNYLRATGLRVGLILNFKYARLQFRRVTLTPPEIPTLQS